MKKILAILLAAMMLLCFVACDTGDNPNPNGDNPGVSQNGGENNNGGGSNNGGANTVAAWKTTGIDEGQIENFENFTKGIPEPTSAYTVSMLNAYSFVFDFANEADAQTWAQALVANGFEYTNAMGSSLYQNSTHLIAINGCNVSITTN